MKVDLKLMRFLGQNLFWC